MRDLDLLTSGFNPCASSDLLAWLVCTPNNDHLHPVLLVPWNWCFSWRDTFFVSQLWISCCQLAESHVSQQMGWSATGLPRALWGLAVVMQRGRKRRSIS